RPRPIGLPAEPRQAGRRPRVHNTTEIFAPSLIEYFFSFPFAFTTTFNFPPVPLLTSRSKTLANEWIFRKAILSHSFGSRGVISKLLKPVGRIPNNPSVYMRQYNPLSADR